MRLCWYPEIFYSPCSPLDEGAGDAHRHRLCMNHRLPPSSSSLSLSTYLPSDDSNNNSWVNILFTVISGAFYPFLSEYRGGGMYFLFIFLLLLFALAVCIESAIISSIPSECSVSPLCDLIWRHPCRLGSRTQRRWILVLWRVSLFSRWESDLPRGKRKEALHRERGPVLIALIAKHNLQTEPAGIEEVRQPDQYTHFHNKHVEYVWERSSMQDLFPSLFPSWMTHWMLCPGTSPISFVKWLDLEVRFVRYWTPTALQSMEHLVLIEILVEKMTSQRKSSGIFLLIHGERRSSLSPSRSERHLFEDAQLGKWAHNCGDETGATAESTVATLQTYQHSSLPTIFKKVSTEV